jgi:polyhydroxyalkanoate synthesis regulator phasin
MAISEACKWEIKEEVDQMVDRGDAATKSEAFDAMVEFYRTIGIEIKKGTVERKYYRANTLTNVSNEETPTAPSDSEEIKEIKRQPAKDGTMRGGPRPGAGRKMNPQPTPEEVFRKKYNAFLKEVKKAQSAGWETVPYGVACDLIGDLNNYV